MSASTESCWPQIEQLKEAFSAADALVIGAGAGLSASAGLTYSGERFERLFSDFRQKYGITDMYAGGFYPFDTPEEYWAWWSRHILCNRYEKAPLPVYDELLALVKDREYFVLTTNVDHQFQLAGFDKRRLFYTQGDYGLWQCARPCHDQTYDNEAAVRQMAAQQRDMKIPPTLVPHCPICGAPMTMNLRCDDTFVQDAGWYAAQSRYADFIRQHRRAKVLYLELGVGGNTPGIIKLPFWQYTLDNPNAVYACVNLGQAYAPAEIASRSICIDADIGGVLTALSRKI
ncbi:MAG: SIR2 family NAD-dependent protein deacylase [Aristaeellaceae bacterium]